MGMNRSTVLVTLGDICLAQTGLLVKECNLFSLSLCQRIIDMYSVGHPGRHLFGPKGLLVKECNLFSLSLYQGIIDMYSVGHPGRYLFGPKGAISQGM